MPVIQGLPTAFALPDGSTVDLSVWPDSPRGRDDPEREALHDEWRAKRQALRRYRLIRRDQCDHDPEQQEIEREKCRRYGSSYFLAVWGWMDDPRISPTTEKPIGPTPFIPYPFQIDMLRWFDVRLQSRGAASDGLISKSRDMGATWCACGYSLHGWLFKPSFQVRLISRKEELVDRKNDPDAMFTKIDYIMDRLPSWMWPQGFNREIHRLQLRLHNPENKNGITGESTTSKTLRGGRTTIAFYDEAAFIPGFLNVWATGVNAASSRIAISSESLEEGDDFVKLRTGAGQTMKPTVLELDFWLHPEHGEAWLAGIIERFGPDDEGLQREVFRNPHAGFGTFIYREAQQIAVGDYPYVFGMPVYLGIDPGLQDLCAMVALARDPLTTRFRCVEAYAARGFPPEYYASLLLGIPDGAFDYRPSRVYDPEAWMNLMRLLEGFTLFGDPAGHNKTMNRQDSWYSKMQEYYVSRHPFGRGLPIIVNWQMDARKYQGRRTALMRLLPQIDFNDTPGVRALLDSVKDHKFEKATSSRLNEPAKPRHDDDSHPVAALEYISVNLEAMRDAAIPTSGVLDAA